MAFSAPGNNITQRIVFNSGTIDFGTNRLVDLENINFKVEWSTSALYVINSIKPQDLVRHSQKVTLTGKIKAFAAELQQFALGSSTAGTPLEIDTLDGQPTLQNPVITLFDRNAKQYQYQLTGAIFKSSSLSARMEEFADFDFEMEAKDVTLLYTQ